MAVPPTSGIDRHGIGNETRVQITGMHCAGCVQRVEKSLSELPGVDDVQVNLVTGQARMHHAVNGPTVQAIETAISQLGFQIESNDRPVNSNAADSSTDDGPLSDLRYFRIAAVCAIVVMVVTMRHATSASHWLQFALTLPIVFVAWRTLLLPGMRSLIRLRPDMDSLVAVGTLAAFGVSTVATVLPRLFPSSPVFFEASGMILVFVLTGRLLEQRARRQTTAAIDDLIRRQPAMARVVRDGTIVAVAAADVTAGEIVHIRAGERVPVDGTILDGAVAIDESSLTGEPLPMERTIGASVFAGTLVENGSARCQVVAAGSGTQLQRIVQFVRDAQGTRAPIARLADRICGVFVPVVLAIALIAGLAWLTLSTEGIRQSILVAVSVLVVSCPCALGLATPTAITVAMGRAARMGILIRDGDALQTAHRVDTVLLDKTGTLTTGRPIVATVIALADTTDDDVIRFAAAVESSSTHPLAAAIIREATDRSINIPQVTEFSNAAGLGASGRVDGWTTQIGSLRYLDSIGISTETAIAELRTSADRQHTVIGVAVDGVCTGLIAVSDSIRPESRAAIDRLRKMRIEPILVSGDHEQAVQAVAAELSITRSFAGTLPQGKHALVEQLQRERRVVAMVGDGINDAPALSRADLGVAMGTGTDIAIEAADVTLVGGRVEHISTMIELSRRTMRVIRQNLFFAFVYNIVGIPLAAGVLYPAWRILLPPMFASAAMALSSICVVTNSLRLRNFHTNNKFRD